MENKEKHNNNLLITLQITIVNILVFSFLKSYFFKQASTVNAVLQPFLFTYIMVISHLLNIL